MASISSPTFPSPSTRSDSSPHKFTLPNTKVSSRLKRLSTSTLHSHSLSTSHSLPRVSDSTTLCRCHNNDNDDHSGSPRSSDNSPIYRRWDSAIHEFAKNAIKRFDDYVSSYLNQSKDVKDVVKSGGVVKRESEVADDDEDWDWDRWRKHFSEVDEQERIVSILKSQLVHTVNREDYEDAARIKVAIAAAATSDTVGRVMSHLNRAVEEERYRDAAFIRDYAGAGLVGCPRQLATATAGAPLFEIFLTINKKGEYKQKAVYLKRRKVLQDFPIVSSKLSGPPSSLNPLDPTGDKNDLFSKRTEDTDDGEDRDDDSDLAEGLSGFENILRDMIPGVKVKVLKVTAPGKVGPGSNI
ncbi:hypothetical protein F0562_028872 [Nyssa sinensis]|uniref:Uncharacterized protein n=1 Tax=Nyssa sinensis TaxID=561372 RepID=A0A5J5B191_9ASTE|nr:hypothetical protein F0562_028872 [Nyssa sinensis]